MTPRRVLLVGAVIATLLALGCQRGASEQAPSAASPVAAVAAGASDLTLELDLGDPLASLDDVTEIADEGDDMDQLAVDEALDDIFVPDEHPDFTGLATPDFEQEIDLGE